MKLGLDFTFNLAYNGSQHVATEVEMTRTVDLNKMSKQAIAEFFMEQSTQQTGKLLFDIYVRFVTDQLDADYLQEIGQQFGVDLERQFIDYVTSADDEEDENV